MLSCCPLSPREEILSSLQFDQNLIRILKSATKETLFQSFARLLKPNKFCQFLTFSREFWVGFDRRSDVILGISDPNEDLSDSFLYCKTESILPIFCKFRGPNSGLIENLIGYSESATQETPTYFDSLICTGPFEFQSQWLPEVPFAEGEISSVKITRFAIRRNDLAY